MIELEPAHLVGTGGAIGAWLRYSLTTLIDSREFPLGTLSVNVLGSFLLGLVTFSGANSDAVLLFGTGLCGSFTTFSSFSFETVRLWETGDRARALANALANLVGAGLAIALAWLLVRAISL